jgi:hypothetical protein
MQPPPSAFRAKALGGANHPHPRVINSDKDAAYPPAIVQLKAERELWRRTANTDRYSTSITSWNRITGPSNAECASAKASVPSGEPGARSQATIHMIRKGQACESAPGGIGILLHRFILALFAATN